MSEESILRILKGNKKLIAVIIVVSIITTIILIPIILIIDKQQTVDDLYQKSRAGIYIEKDSLILGDSISFDVAVRYGDVVHWHCKAQEPIYTPSVRWYDAYGWSWHFNPNTMELGGGTLTFEIINRNDQFTNVPNDTTIHNLRIFVIVYDKYYPPDCPLC